MGMDSRGHPAGMPAKTKPMMVAGGMVGLLVGACTGERRAKKSSICVFHYFSVCAVVLYFLFYFLHFLSFFFVVFFSFFFRWCFSLLFLVFIFLSFASNCCSFPLLCPVFFSVFRPARFYLDECAK